MKATFLLTQQIAATDDVTVEFSRHISVRGARYCDLYQVDSVVRRLRFNIRSHLSVVFSAFLRILSYSVCRRSLFSLFFVHHHHVRLLTQLEIFVLKLSRSVSHVFVSLIMFLWVAVSAHDWNNSVLCFRKSQQWNIEAG